MAAFSKMHTHQNLVCMLLILSAIPLVCAGGYYDSNSSDNFFWTHRIALTFIEKDGIKRINEPVSLNLSYLFGKVNLSLVDKESIRLVDPDKKRIDELNGHAQVFQLDDDGDGVLSGADELSFLAEVDAYARKLYYIYYSEFGSGITNESYTSDLTFKYDGGKSLLVENDRLMFEGFSTGYFALYRIEPKFSGINFAYNPLGLDHGYSIESSRSNESFVRYDKDWLCTLVAAGPVRVKLKCTSSSANVNVVKVFTFYSKNSFYDTENIITKKDPLLSNVRWVIYDTTKPYFTNETGKYSRYTNGSGEDRMSYLTALDSQSRYSFEIIARGDMDLYLEDRTEGYDHVSLFGETLSMLGASEKKASVRHALVKADSDEEARQHIMFRSPLASFVLPSEENKLILLEPNSSVVYDVAYENQSSVSIKASIDNGSGVYGVYCNITDSFGKTLYHNINLFNDGTHGDENPNDYVWANNDSIKLYPQDVTGVWSISCTEKGSQSVPTSTNSTFYVVKNGGYRRIGFFNIYCKSGERFKHNPAKVHPGGFAELHICLMNTGSQDEENIRVSMPDVPLGWSLEDVYIEKLVRGDEIPTVMKLYIPETQKPSSNKLKIEITANGTLTGLDSVLVDVVYPKLDSSVSINGKSLFVKAVDGDLPVQDAQVRLSYSSGRIQSAKTDARGVAEIPAIEAGDILISVSKIGDTPSDINISLSETEEKSYWFILPMAVTIAVLAHLVYTRGIQLKSRLKISSRKNK